MFELLSLEEIHLNDNKLIQLPKGLFTSSNFRSMSKLVTLNLENNQIKTLGDENFFMHAGELRELNLEKNPLEDLEPFGTYYKDLKYIDGETNETVEISPLSKLSRLKIDADKIYSLPARMFDRMKSLEILYVDQYS